MVKLGRDNLSRRIRAHAPRVRTGVTVPDALVILRRWRDDKIATGEHDENRCFVAEQTVLNQNLTTTLAKLPAFQHVAHGGFGLVQSPRHDHAFPGRQSICLDDDWE